MHSSTRVTPPDVTDECVCTSVIASAKIPKPSAPSDPPRHVAPVAHGMTTTSPPAYEGHQEYTHTRTHAATSNATHAAVIHACLPSDHDQVPHVYELCGMQHACPCPCSIHALCREACAGPYTTSIRLYTRIIMRISIRIRKSPT